MRKPPPSAVSRQRSPVIRKLRGRKSRLTLYMSCTGAVEIRLFHTPRYSTPRIFDIRSSPHRVNPLLRSASRHSASLIRMFTQPGEAQRRSQMATFLCWRQATFTTPSTWAHTGV
ncbi:hypothetical protein NDU88_006944 [Pleurodeles waltl]|uniref:Uncharacterized protein n=1 Tax=Pleurodeles waltl TaxID=8319 RepID=A0AAV7N2V2_PLEWA|nr:hypothetical protein NDU88_006944 [Pleurodeles waltl]